MSEVQTSTGSGRARRAGAGGYGKPPPDRAPGRFADPFAGPFADPFAGRPGVLVIGHLAEDRTPEGPRLGGAAAYAGLLLRRWGVPTEILTAADAGFPFLDALTGAGIGLTGADSPTRTVFENRYRADGSREQRLRSRAAPIPESAVAPAVAALPPGSTVLYAPIADELPGRGPLPRPAGPGSFAAAIPQGMLRRADPETGRITLAAPDGFARRLAGLDLVCLGEEEAAVAGLRSAPPGDPSPDDLAAGRGARRPLLALTKGATGAVLLGPSPPDPPAAAARPISVPAFPARAVDPTGAGDVFAAALLFGLRRGEPLRRAALRAAAAAALTVEAPGVAGIPDLPEAEALRSRGPEARSGPG